MAEYLEFSLLDEKGVERNVMMNKDDPNEVYLWRDRFGGYILKNPYWRKCVVCDKESGYYSISITKKHYLLHRVCYYAHNPEWNIYDTSWDNLIDHIDRNKLNTNISNLRVVTNAQNMENINAKGYWYNKKIKRWVAYLKKDGKVYRKHCKTEKEAVEAREKLKAMHHSF